MYKQRYKSRLILIIYRCRNIVSKNYLGILVVWNPKTCIYRQSYQSRLILIIYRCQNIIIKKLSRYTSSIES